MVKRVVVFSAVVIFLTGVLAWADKRPVAGNIKIDCAYYHADIGGQYDWSEAAPGLTDFSKTDRRAGLLKVYVSNGDNQAVPVEAVSLNGTPLDDLRNNGRHEVIWWRTWPSPVPAQGFAEVSVRLRYPLEADAVLSLRAGETELEVTVTNRPPAFRIETIAWADGGRQVTLVAQQMPTGRSEQLKRSRLDRVLLDGQDVTRQARIVAPDFFHGICPIVLRLEKGLKLGSFHTYKLVAADGTTAACTLRTLDDFLRLDMYGAGDLEQNVKLGINSTTHFRSQSGGTLDRFADYGLRSAFHVGQSPPPQVIGHPAVYAYLLHDEPDVWDYGFEEWPHGMRIGFHAPDIVRATRQCVAADPLSPVMLTLNLTYKLANYYVYSHIPDIVQPDCYPLTIGRPLTWVHDVTEVCRQAAGPRRVETLPQVNWEDRGPDMKYKRPPFPREVIIQYLYSLGAGARGFSGYEWYTEANHHGANEFPEVMEAVGQVYRRLELVAPLILQAHPTEVATCGNEHVWLKTLVCGSDSLLLVAVNGDYESLPKDFLHQIQQPVVMRLPAIPWLEPTQALRVDDGRFTELSLQPTADGTRITLPKLDTGEVILVTDNDRLGNQLQRRFHQQQQQVGLVLLQTYQKNQRNRAQAKTLVRKILGRYADYVIATSVNLNAYGAETTALWNPTETKYNAIEWWTENTPRGGQWQVNVGGEQTNVEHTIYFQMNGWYGGGYLRVELLDEEGKIIMEKDRPTWTGPIPHFTVMFPQDGEYMLRILQAGEGKPGGRLARAIYVVPQTAPPLHGAAW